MLAFATHRLGSGGRVIDLNIPKYVVVYADAAGGEPATLHPDFRSAALTALNYLLDRDADLMTEVERLRVEARLLSLTGDDVETIHGIVDWDERVIISPIASP